MAIISNTQFVKRWQSAKTVEEVVSKTGLPLEQVLMRSCFLRRSGEDLSVKPVRALRALAKTDAQMVRVAELYAAGHLYPEIARIIGHANAKSLRVLFAEWRSRHGVTLVRRQGFPDPSDEEAELFISLHDTNEPDEVIANQLGITTACIHQWRAYLRETRGTHFPYRRLMERTGPRLSQRTRDIIAALESGRYQQDVAKEFGVSRQYVSLVANTYKVTEHPNYRTKVGPSDQLKKTQAALAQIRKLRGQRKTYDEIADAVGVNKSFIAQVIREELAAGRMERLGPREPSSEDRQVQELWNKGWSAGRIADKLNIPTTKVYYIKRICSARGMDFVEHHERTASRDALIKQGLREGWDRDTLQQETQLSWYTLADRLRSGEFGNPDTMPVLRLRPKSLPVYRALQDGVKDFDELCDATGKDGVRLLQCVRDIAVKGFKVPKALRDRAQAELGY